MKSLILNINPIILGLSIFIVIAIAILVVVSLKKSPKKEKETTKKEIDVDIEKNEKFMYFKEVVFYDYLSSILPSEYIAFPKVAVSLLVNPTNTKHAFNEINGKILDVVIFEKSTMCPVLVLDCYDTSYSNGMLEELEPFVIEVLKKANIEILALQVKNQLNKEEIKTKVLEKLKNDKKM